MIDLFVRFSLSKCLSLVCGAPVLWRVVAAAAGKNCFPQPSTPQQLAPHCCEGAAAAVVAAVL